MKKFAVETKSQDEYDFLMEQLKKIGKCWKSDLRSGDWKIYKRFTCVNISGEFLQYYSPHAYFNNDGFTLLNLKEYCILLNVKYTAPVKITLKDIEKELGFKIKIIEG